MMQLGVNAIGVTNDKMLSPTRAIIQGRETILAGTNNYMGITFDADCIEAGKQALDEFGTGTTGSRIANGSYALHTELGAGTGERSSIASTASCSPRAIRPTSA